MSPPSSCILTRQNEAIEPVASRRILLRLPPNFVLPLVAFAYNSHYISFFSLSLSLADCATKFEFSTKFEQFHWEKGAATERESTIGERNYEGINDTDDSASYPAVFYLKIRDVRGMPGRNVGARGTDKGDRDSRPSVPVSCLRERNKIV